MTGNIAILDIDGCLCASQYVNIKHNDNSRLLSKEFQLRLRSNLPFPWVKRFKWDYYEKLHFITGRMEAHHLVTMEWLRDIFPDQTATLHHVEWNDSYETRQQSYEDYVKRKTAAIIDQYENTMTTDYVDVFEDDARVMAGIIDYRRDNKWCERFMHLYLVAGGALFKECDP